VKKRFARTFEGIRRLGISGPLPSRIYHPYLEITYKRGGGDETEGPFNRKLGIVPLPLPTNAGWRASSSRHQSLGT